MGDNDSSFLSQEYKSALEQLRYYDSRQHELLKYLLTLTSAVATAQFAIVQGFGQQATSRLFLAQAFFLFVVFFASTLIYLMMLQNRLYFVFMARQVNAIRKYFLRTEAAGFNDNQLWTSTNFTAFKCLSLHSYQLIGTAFISSLFAAASSFALLHGVFHLGCAVVWSLLVFFLVGITEIVGGSSYLHSAGKKSADEAIHKTVEQTP